MYRCNASQVCFAGLNSSFFYSSHLRFCFLHTIGGSIGQQEIRQQAFLDGGMPTQGLLVQDEQEAMELHQELVQHCRHRRRERERETSFNDKL